MTDNALKISDFIRSDCIFLDVDMADKESLLRYLAEKSCEKGLVADSVNLLEGFRAREASMSTGVGLGLAFPHTLTPEREKAAVVIVRLSKIMDYGAIDDMGVDVIFAVLIPECDQTQHLQILARVSRLCKRREFVTTVRRARDPEILKKSILRIEEEFNGFVYQG
jgi:mannitol/fructose-specific phosphotransferase system IIA component (Ntr-type)